MKTVKFLSVLNTLGGTETIDRLFASQFCTTEDEASLTWFMLLMALSALQRQGHTCVDVRKLANTPLFVDETQQLNGWCYPAEEQLEHAIEQAMKNSVVASALVYQHGRLYTRRYWQFEREIGQALAQRCAPLTLSDEDYARLNTLWPGMFSTDPTAEQDWQQLATACAVQQRFTVLGWCDDNLLLHASGRWPPVMVSHGTLISTRAVALITCGLPAPRHVLFCYHLP